MRVIAIMMQKNEGRLLARWMGHYATLFGKENLVVLDNASDDPETVALLRRFETDGVRVDRHHNLPWHFHNKGTVIADIIRELDATTQYDFALPVDCDELLCAITQEGLSRDRQAILAAFEEHRGSRHALQIDFSFFNVIGQPGWFAPDTFFHKGFLPARSIASLDGGFHEPRTRFSNEYRSTRLVYLHYHNRLYEAVLDKALQKLVGMVDTSDLAAVRELIREKGSIGGHLAPIFLDGPQAYYTRYERDLQVMVNDGGGACNFVRIANDCIAWDTDSYLRCNPDVGQYELPPMHHYIKYGYREGRRLA